ncbi:MAG TPA: hypothetical protein VJ689_08945 [Gaiellaceae bacterium]|nr:hypothetical protein [Gaiellaceae bacterium]
MGTKRVLAAVIAVLAVCGAAWAGDGGSPLAVSGVSIRVPDGWSRTTAAVDAVSDPRTVLVVGTDGVQPRRSSCQVSAYRVPADGAAVVVIGWRGKATAAISRDRAVLGAMRLRRPYFECWAGRGASAQIALHGRAYQVNVLVGDQASPGIVADALRAARSVDVAE